MKVLFIGEIVGKCGIFCVKTLLPILKECYQFDFVIANADGATGGFGLGKNHSIYLHKLGIDVLTGGECIYYKRDLVEHLNNASYILRPANYPYGNPGRGYTIINKEVGRLAVISLLGAVGYERTHLANPFLSVKPILEKIKEQTLNIVIDFHATTTSEKYTMFHYLTGQVSAVIGTHSKALTADAQILGGHTAVLCDAGRTGNALSAAGLDSEVEIRKYLTQIHEYSKLKCENLELQGALLEIGQNGQALAIQLIKEPCLEVFHERNLPSNEN